MKENKQYRAFTLRTLQPKQAKDKVCFVDNRPENLRQVRQIKAIHSSRPIQLYTEEGGFQDDKVVNFLMSEDYLDGSESPFKWDPFILYPPYFKPAMEYLDSCVGKQPLLQIGEWYSKDEFTEDVISRIKNPELIDQERTSTCGVTAILSLQADRRPDKFVKNITDLYYEGKLEGKSFNPTRFSRGDGDEARNGLANIDWLYIVFFRSKTNAIWPYNGGTCCLNAYTLPSTIPGWMEKELETTDATNYHLYGEGAWSKLLQVADGVSDSTAIVLYVNADGYAPPKYGEYEPGCGFEFAHHFVAVTDVKKVDDDTLRLQYYNWGEKCVKNFSKAQIKKFTWRMTIGHIKST